MKIPDKLKICGHVVDVERTERKNMDGPTCGDFHTRYNRIRVDIDHAESQMACTLLHEVIEWAASSLELKMEHRQVSALAETLFQVLRDNDLDFRNTD